MFSGLKKYDFKPNPILDQNFMTDSELIKKIVELAKIKQNETILEIGPGTGNLTKEIARKAKVIAIELDERFKPILKKELTGKNIKLLWGNALDILKNKKLKFDKIVSNLPFSISEPLIQLLINYEFKLAVLTIPENFAYRITAKLNNKNYSKLSLLVQSSFKVRKRFLVFPQAWYPEPKTNSIVIELIPKTESDYRKDKIGYVTRQLFLQKDKKLKNALREGIISLHIKILNKKFTKREAKEIIKKLDLDKSLLEKNIQELDIGQLKEIICKLRV